MLEGYQKAFESKIRLGIMSILMVNEWVDFVEIKSRLETSDGNLAGHVNALEKAGFIEIRKSFIGKRPNTSYRCTTDGRIAFNKHIASLENIIRNKP